ncbi:IclR family transcriptional regulator [Sciscionella marina]|uniref:IclR family transcriptional regulator n=1 Tax=Sciscionella marina TaxID=508770 RepID=UPI0003768FA3|nr:IclR family transcriptional regulator [Sciscionella marina]
MKDLSGVQAVDRVAALLRVVSTAGGTLAETARATELSEATALRYLTALEHYSLVERDPGSRAYRVGPGLLELANGWAGGEDVLAAAEPGMRRLLEEFGETVNLGVRAGETLIVVHALESPRPIRKGASVGERDHWNCTALGKALLAAMPEAEAKALANSAMSERLTERTRTSWTALLGDLRTARDTGYAVDDEESSLGLRCIGAAITDRSGAPRYAISVSGPGDRLPVEQDSVIGERVAAEAAAVAVRLGGR